MRREFTELRVISCHEAVEPPPEGLEIITAAQQRAGPVPASQRLAQFKFAGQRVVVVPLACNDQSHGLRPTARAAQGPVLAPPHRLPKRLRQDRLQPVGHRRDYALPPLKNKRRTEEIGNRRQWSAPTRNTCRAESHLAGLPQPPETAVSWHNLCALIRGAGWFSCTWRVGARI